MATKKQIAERNKIRRERYAANGKMLVKELLAKTSGKMIKMRRYAGPVLEASPYKEAIADQHTFFNTPLHRAREFGQPSWPKEGHGRMTEQARKLLNEVVFTGPQVDVTGFGNCDQLATPRSEIDAVLGDICHSLDDLENAQGQCFNAIADILRQENPPAQTPQETAVIQSAPLVNRLRSILRNLETIINRQVAINVRIVL